nr:ABC transporter permease [Pseudoclavibacter sp. Marseille-Q3772]
MSTSLTTTTADASSSEGVLAPPKLRTPILLGVFALISLLVFVFQVAPDVTTSVDLNSRSVDLTLPQIEVPTFITNLILTLGMFGIAAFAFMRAKRRERVPMWSIAIYATLWVFALILWTGAGNDVPLTWLFTGSLVLATPIVFGSLAGIVSERAGVVNLAIEGQLLSGAFAAALVASLTDSWIAGVLAAAAAGVLVSCVLALFAITYWVEQVVVGVVINMIVIGLTNYLYSALLATDPAKFNDPARYPSINIPGLSQIPVLGPLLFQHTVLGYVMLLLVPLMGYLLFKSRWGLRTRAVGEHPKAADTVGINVNATRWRNVLLSGVIAGVGGSFYTIGSVGAFSSQITSGQGYIALAAVIFGGWHPIYSALAALLFGFASNFQTFASQAGSQMPSELLAMVPYVVTVLAVIGFVGKSKAPAADGVPYIQSGR